MPILELPGGTIRYDVQGHGEALVLIPGFASGAWSWSWQIEELARSFEVISFDPMGIGASTIEEGNDVSIAGLADNVVSIIEATGVGQAHIAGISFGGFVAQTLALEHPDRVKRLVLASTSFGGPNHVAPAMPVLAAFVSTEGLNSPDRIRRSMTLAFTPDFVNSHGVEVERFCRLREDSPVHRDVYMQQLQSALAFNVENRISNIDAPTLVITGETDIVVPPANSRNLASAIPNSRLEVIAGAGHMVFVEKAEELNRLMVAFLQDGASENG